MHVPSYPLMQDLNKNLSLKRLLNESGFETSSPFGTKLIVYSHYGVPYDQWTQIILEKLNSIINSAE